MLENIAQWSKLLVLFSIVAIFGLVFPSFISIDAAKYNNSQHNRQLLDTIPYPVSIQYEQLDTNIPLPHRTFPVEKAGYPFSNASPISDGYVLQSTTDTLNLTRKKNVEGLTITKTVHVCQGEGYFVANKPRFVSGVFRDTLNTVQGRDSIVVTNLSVITCKYSE
jgi:hypothetical protein